MLSVAVVWFSSGCVAIRYVLPVLWTTSYLNTMARDKGHEKGVYTSQNGVTWALSELARRPIVRLIHRGIHTVTVSNFVPYLCQLIFAAIL